MKKMKSIYILFNIIIPVVVLHLFLFKAAEGKTFTREQIIEKLQNLDDTCQVKVLISRTSENTANSGDDMISNRVSVDIEAEYKQGDLIIYYPQTLLERIDKERQENEKDPDSPMPIRIAAESINISEICNLITAQETLIRLLKIASLVTQSNSRYKEQDAALVEFDVQLNLSKQEKKYVKHFTSKLKLWLDENGLPLASEMHFTMKGRAFLVVSFEGENSETIEYRVCQNRLLAVYKKTFSKNSGGGESGETRSVTALSVLSIGK